MEEEEEDKEGYEKKEENEKCHGREKKNIFGTDRGKFMMWPIVQHLYFVSIF